MIYVAQDIKLCFLTYKKVLKKLCEIRKAKDDVVTHLEDCMIKHEIWGMADFLEEFKRLVESEKTALSELITCQKEYYTMSHFFAEEVKEALTSMQAVTH